MIQAVNAVTEKPQMTEIMRIIARSFTLMVHKKKIRPYIAARRSV